MLGKPDPSQKALGHETEAPPRFERLARRLPGWRKAGWLSFHVSTWSRGGVTKQSHVQLEADAEPRFSRRDVCESRCQRNRRLTDSLEQIQHKKNHKSDSTTRCRTSLGWITSREPKLSVSPEPSSVHQPPDEDLTHGLGLLTLK